MGNIWFLLSLSALLYGQNVLKIKYDHLSVNQGLSSNAVECIYQDHLGYMWFGTQDGLSRYDGYSFTNYYHDPNDNSSLSNNTVYEIYDDGRFLWIGTAGELNRFDPLSGEFKTLPVYSVASIVKDSSGLIWAGSLSDGLYGMDQQMNIRYSLSKQGDQRGLSSNFIMDLLYDTKRNLWVCTEGGGITRISFKSDSLVFRYYRHNASDPTSIGSDFVTSVCQDGAGNYWFGTHNNGLHLLTKSGGFKHFYHESGKRRLSSNSIRSVIFDSFSNSVWVGTYGNDLCRIEKSQGKKYLFTSVIQEPFSIGTARHYSPTSLYIDRFGSLWRGSYHSGVYKCTLPQIEFRTYRLQKISRRYSGADYAWSFYEDVNKHIWVGGIRGVCLLKPGKTAREELRGFYFPHSDSMQIRRIIKDKKGTIWAATLGKGLVKLELNDDQVTGIPVKFTELPFGSKNLYCLLADKQNDSLLWTGSNGAGLIKFNTYSGKTLFYKVGRHVSDRYQEPGWVCSMYQDRQGLLWLGTWSNGLCRFNPANGRVKFYRTKDGMNSINSNTVLYIHALEDTILWLGTKGGGLNRFDIRSETFKAFTTNEGLPNNVVYSIVSDNRRNLWIGTNKGLAFIRNKDQKIKYFTIEDGLPSDEFNLGACFKSSRGDLFFGSTEGIVLFRPIEAINSHPPQIQLTSFKKYGKTIQFEKPLHQICEFNLSYNERLFSLEFIGLHYKNSARNQYAYMLEGIDGDWIYCGTNRKASYQNIPPGKYIFKIKAANCDGVWTEKPTELSLLISPPFWRNTWFYIFSFLMITMIFVTAHRLRLKQILRIEKAKLAERERLRRKMAADFHDELGHRISKISLLSKILLNKPVPQEQLVKQYLNQIADNADHLFAEMKEFVWELDPRKDSVYDLMSQLKSFSDQLFDTSEIAFQIEGLNPQLENRKVSMEWRQNILRLFKEGLTNILKHAKNCKTVRLQIMCKERQIVITLYDDGPGFDVNAVQRGNGLNNMYRRAEVINGTLQIISHSEKGTKIIFSGELP